MGVINATNARKNLYKLIKEVGESHEPITITGKESSAVLVSEDNWHAIQETLYLLSITGYGIFNTKRPKYSCRTM